MFADSAWTQVFKSFVHTLRSMISGSYSKSIFSFIRNHYTDFQSGYPILYSLWQWIRVPVASHTPQHLMCLVFCISASPQVCSGISLFFICNFLMMYDIEHLFICFFVICISSLAKYLFRRFNFDEVQLMNFSFMIIVFNVVTEKSLPKRKAT